MGEKKDYHAKGQHDREKSRGDGFWDIVGSGGKSPHYNSPKGNDNKKEYKSGWDNAKKNHPK